MKQGKTLETLGAELQRQRAVRKDFLADTKSLVFKTEGRNSIMSVLTEKGAHDSHINDLAHQQIATRLGIPYRYYLCGRPVSDRILAYFVLSLQLDKEVDILREKWKMAGLGCEPRLQPRRWRSAHSLYRRGRLCVILQHAILWKQDGI